ncbi:MAG: spondin domain-containing protein [Rhodospirillales bacterium]|nr:spondin domain-containing protein [Rhodospirillales bacterium]
MLGALGALGAGTTLAQEPVRAYLMNSAGASPLGPVSELHIVNTSDSDLRFSGTLYSAEGTRLGEAGQALSDAATAANSRLILTSWDIEERFGIGAWVQPAMLEIHADVENAPVVAMIRQYSGPGGLATNVNCVTEDAVHNIEGYDRPDRTYVRLINTADVAISDIRGTLRGADGEVIGSADRMLMSSLGPKVQAWLSGEELAVLVGAVWRGQASLHVSRHHGLKLMNLNRTGAGALLNFSCHERAIDSGRFDTGAAYTVTFTARWTAQEHGPVPSAAHFTTLVGAATNAGADLWVPGEVATEGLENVAELGLTSEFIGEIAVAAADMNASSAVTGTGTSNTGASTFELNVSRSLPRFTFATMVAPSPDWFVGLSEFSLLDAHGGWIDDTGHMNLPVYDAGTETGEQFSLGGVATVPAQPIGRLTVRIGETDIVNGVVNGTYLATVRLQRIR